MLNYNHIYQAYIFDIVNCQCSYIVLSLRPPGSVLTPLNVTIDLKAHVVQMSWMKRWCTTT